MHQGTSNLHQNSSNRNLNSPSSADASVGSSPSEVKLKVLSAGSAIAPAKSNARRQTSFVILDSSVHREDLRPFDRKARAAIVLWRLPCTLDVHEYAHMSRIYRSFFEFPSRVPPGACSYLDWNSTKDAVRESRSMLRYTTRRSCIWHMRNLNRLLLAWCSIERAEYRRKC